MTDTIPQTPARSLHDIFEAVRQVTRGYCWFNLGDSCGFTGTRARPIDGWHLARFARAHRKGLLSEADMPFVLEAVGDVFHPGTVIWDGAR